jgi:hypothetical protein
VAAHDLSLFVILRNALLLLKESDSTSLGQIEQWISQIAAPVKLNVSHDNESDLYINSTIEINGEVRPLELAGTGYIQLIQIFCYILLFKPGILLIDEPDIHLHPHVQERLVGVLASVARERLMKVLMTTHSPFVVRGTSAESSVCWLNDGCVESEDRPLIELALGWGAFAKKLILITEDSNTSSLLRLLISQWPEIERQISFHPGNGWKLLPKPRQAGELAKTLGHKFKILVHRDRDSLTSDERQTLSQAYLDEGVNIGFTSESDVESYFCLPEFISSHSGVDLLTATGFISTVLTRDAATIQDQFVAQRRAHNEELYHEGGSPRNQEVLQHFGAENLQGAKGKHVYNKLKNLVPGNVFNESGFRAALGSVEIASDLKTALLNLLNS